MATANDVINDAARRLGILAGEEALTSAEAADALTRLNDMMHGFGPAGIAYAHTTLTANSTVNMPDELIGSLKWMMADTLVDDYGVQLTERQMGQIADAKNQLQAAYHVQPPAGTEPILRPRLWGTYDITTDS